ncbi:Membrane-spanning 4-domains subfamily A member 12-like [Scleropages formosus]|uniref:Membrane-spanning 4-domains subfamily A member 12-like n=1 Tax=Scleropages formosus TaxID=113540 RepID=A0A0P7XXG4_SCLFO|nr:Membrane-spanning 4-domains subfamily A member 12-like [Scleropages formosus]
MAPPYRPPSLRPSPSLAVLRPGSRAMDVSVSRNLSVTVTDHSADKLRERQQMLRVKIQRAESKALGISQVMVGLMVMSYSLPLLFTNFTQVVTFGVPWWSGIVFIAAGAVAIETEKHGDMRLVSGAVSSPAPSRCALPSHGRFLSNPQLRVCLLVTVAAAVASILALIFYFVDLLSNPEKMCEREGSHVVCDPEYYCQAFSRGLKSCLLLFTVTQAAVSATLSFLLYRERRSFTAYMSLTENVPAGGAPLDCN